MSTPQPKPTVGRSGKPDALDDPTKMALAAPLLTEGIELAATKMREENRGGLFLDLAVSAARRFAQQSIQIAGQPEPTPPGGA